MQTPQLEQLLKSLIAVVESISRRDYSAREQLFEMTDDSQFPPTIARFAEAFGMMTIQVEAREFHLEQTIEDLTQTKEALTLANEKLQQSMRELQQTQMQLIQQEKMESVGRLAAGVAHEVKNPLAVIQLGTDFLADQLRENPICYETVMDMADAVHRADTVIKGLLNFSRSEELELLPTSLESLVAESLILVRHELTTRQIVVQTEWAPELPTLNLDRNKIKQVLINLFMNACHAIGQTGEITVLASLHTLTDQDLTRYGSCNGLLRAGDRVVRAVVQDTGSGIEEKVSSKLFDPFFTTKPIGLGTGLGLSVTRKILELHQAVIGLQNRGDRTGAEAIMLFKINQTEEGQV